jgi:hypothetical protein
VELTAGPESSEEEEVSVANAGTAALAGEEEAKGTREEAQNEADEVRAAQEQGEGAEAGRTTTDESSVEKGVEVQ